MRIFFFQLYSMFKVLNMGTEITLSALESSALHCEKLLHTELRMPSVVERYNYYGRRCWRRECDRPITWYRQRTHDGVPVTA
jgi:hypothetical protein